MPKRQLRIVHDDPRLAGEADGFGHAKDMDALRDSPRLRALLERSLRAIVAMTGARGGAIRITPAAGAEMRLVAAEGVSVQWLERERSVAADCGMCGQALKADCLQLDMEPASCSGRSASCGGEPLHGPAIAVPLHSRGRVVGVFNLFFGGGARIPADASALIAPVSEMLELTLDNALAEHEHLRSSLLAERQILAGEVHDSLAQGLAFMRMRMSLLRDALASGDAKRALAYFDEVNESLGDAHARLRDLITHFRQVIGEGLVQALQSAARGFEERTGVALRIENRAADLRLAPEHEAEVYQIVQEALANVIKHAGARNVRVVIERSARRLQVSVEDDGCGVRSERAQAAGGHYGLEIMRERAQRIGGDIDIVSAPSKGTRVRLVVPARATAKEAR